MMYSGLLQWALAITLSTIAIGGMWLGVIKYVENKEIKRVNKLKMETAICLEKARDEASRLKCSLLLH